MIYIYMSDSEKLTKQSSLEDLLKYLPKSLHERALRYQSIPAANNFVTGRLLLKHALIEQKTNIHLEDLSYQPSGKPIINQGHFNISHSGNQVVCAWSDHGQIGIDIEEFKEIELASFEKFFQENEWSEILNHETPLKKFYWYWTRKESVIKALSVNLNFLHEIDMEFNEDAIDINGQLWFLHNVELRPNYFACLCCHEPLVDIQIIELDKHQLLS